MFLEHFWTLSDRNRVRSEIALEKKRSYSGGNRIVTFCGLTSRFFLALILFGQTGCASHLLASREQGSIERAEEIKKNLAAIRGLKFTQEVPILFDKKEVMQGYLESGLLEDYGEEKLKDLSLAYAKLGLFPLGMDLRKSLLNLYDAQVLGFYVTKKKKVVLSEKEEKILSAGYFTAADFDEMVLVHELTHALQDQHFSLGNRLGPSDNNDRTLAFRSLAEGDAILTEFAYRFGALDQWSSVQISELFQDGSVELRSTLSEVPAAIVDKLRFQYEAGASFVYRVLKEKGWQGINLLYKFPPQSTEQVLHPEKYFDLPDPPTRVDLKDLSLLFSPGWTPVENNTLGELMVECLFKQFLPKEEAKRVANGWGGDRFVAFRRGEEVSFIWATVWDTPEDAEEFFEMYQEILSRKYGFPQSSDYQFYIKRRDRLVVVVEGLDRTHIKENIEKVWRGMSLEKVPWEHPSPSLQGTPLDSSDTKQSPSQLSHLQ